MMNSSNADILELKKRMGELISVMQEFALEQKVIAEKVRRIEDWLKMGNMQGNTSLSGPKKSFGNDQCKDEGDSSVVYAQRGHGRGRYYQHTAAVTIPAGNQSIRQQPQPTPQKRQGAGNQVKGKGVDRHFDKPPMPYAALFKKLMDLGMVQPRTLAPLRADQWPPNYNENARCEFHSGTQGHDIEGCRAFKHTVQDLLESKALHFSLLTDVNANPIPAHGQVMGNAITEDSNYTRAVGKETNSDWGIDQWIKSCVPGSWKA